MNKSKLSAKNIGQHLHQQGFDLYVGVPCSFLKALINYAMNEEEYLMANNEGDAVATCAGAYLGGRKPVLLIQNSGLTNAVSPITSLLHPFQMPLLGFVSWRGDQRIQDEPQHTLMGQITPDLLSLIGVEYAVLASTWEEAKAQLTHATSVINQGKSFFFIVRKDTFEPMPLTKKPALNHTIIESEPTPPIDTHSNTRASVLEVLQQQRKKHTFLFACTGYTGRELYQLGDHSHQFYMVGSMGCISALVLGVALQKKHANFVAIDGDGALLMRMGAMSSVGYYRPDNLLHMVIDNQMHESTGGQHTVSSNVNFAKIAQSCGYLKAYHINTLTDLVEVYLDWQCNPNLTFIHFSVKPGIMKDLKRPSITLSEVAERMRKALRPYQ